MIESRFPTRDEWIEFGAEPCENAPRCRRLVNPNFFTRCKACAARSRKRTRKRKDHR